MGAAAMRDRRAVTKTCKHGITYGPSIPSLDIHLKRKKLKEGLQ